jgi:hypothetical protein
MSVWRRVQSLRPIRRRLPAQGCCGARVVCAGTGSWCLISGDPRDTLAPATLGRLAGVEVLEHGSPRRARQPTGVLALDCRCHCGGDPVCLSDFLRSHSHMPEYWPFSVNPKGFDSVLSSSKLLPVVNFY